MPAFLNPTAGGSNKRKSDGGLQDEPSRKKPALNQARAGVEQYWLVQWRNPQMKKHKTWDGDAVMIVRPNGYAALYDQEDGKKFGEGKVSIDVFHIDVGETFQVGGKDVEVDRSITRQDYLSGTCFGCGAPAPSPAPIASQSRVMSSGSSMGGLHKQYKPLKPSSTVPNVVCSKPPTASSSTGKGSFRVALEAVSLLSTSQSPTIPSKSTTARDSYWTANWRKPQQRKHKTWDGDAYVACRKGTLTMASEGGKRLGTATWKGDPLFSGYHAYIGGKEVELDAEITAAEFPALTGWDAADASKDDEGGWEGVVTREPHTPQRPISLLSSPAAESSASASKKFVPPTGAISVTSFYGTGKLTKAKHKGPLYDPDAEGAIVMKAPTKEHVKKYNKKELPIIPVVIDPILTRKLRPHQVEGVKFLYECAMGLAKHEGQGCILADEMGLGKTLQTIALVWTLLKQNPYEGAGPVLGKALIVCPVSLVSNWKNEFHKWLGRDRVGVFVGDKDKTVIKQFINSRIHQVLVIGYEKLRTVIADLAYCNPPIGLIICDEGHRLKSANNKTSKMFEALRTPRRVILSGTPIQNDLSEFHAMADFCNPGLLDDYKTFKRVYEDPILKSRAVGCTPKEAEIGEARTAQLLTTAKSFVLRRDATILKSYLPPKCEYVVFITPTPIQLSIFSKLLNADKMDDLVEGSMAESLAMISMLTKISNSPVLLKAAVDAKSKTPQANSIKRNAINEAAKLLPERVKVEDVSLSGKLIALANLLKMIRKNTEEKCILVSHYTSTLNIIEAYCQKKGYTYHRLDGQTPPPKRQEYVNEFNKATQASRFLFLLSAKAGGVGLNLIGASRLVLIDSDWNPSHDLQAMARIHRDGQKRPVFIYRFLTAGTIDEKIYQRQVTKLGLSDSLMGTGTSDKSKSDSFTAKDLRDIFSIHLNTACHTHELLDCPCDGSGAPVSKPEVPSADEGESSSDEDESKTGFRAASQVTPGEINKMDKAYMSRKKAALASLGQWTHLNCLRTDARENVQDDVLRRLIYVPEEKPVSHSKASVGSLLDAVDLGNVLAMEEEEPEGLSARDVPGGTITFLFEKTSKDDSLGPVEEDK